MGETVGVFGRVGKSFRRFFGGGDDDLPLMQSSIDLDPHASEVKPGMFRPFSRRDPAVANLQQSFTALTDLLVSMRDSIERQGRRHEELMTYLSHLPRALEVLPESSRMQTEALSAIRLHIDQQHNQVRQLLATLDRMGGSNVDQKRLMETISERLEVLGEHDQAISDSLSQFGTAMSTATRNSTGNVQVLEQVRDAIRDRDQQLHELLQSQSRRNFWLLTVAAGLVVVAIGLLLAVLVSLPKK
jgi:chromosome segregation ATPase